MTTNLCPPTATIHRDMQLIGKVKATKLLSTIKFRTKSFRYHLLWALANRCFEEEDAEADMESAINSIISEFPDQQERIYHAWKVIYYQSRC